MTRHTNVTMMARALHRFTQYMDDGFHGESSIYWLVRGRQVRADLLAVELEPSLGLEPQQARDLVAKLIGNRFLESWNVRDVLKVSLTVDTMEELKEMVGK